MQFPYRLSLVVAATAGIAAAESVPSVPVVGNGQVNVPITWLELPYEKNNKALFALQITSVNSLLFTASNGFFSSGLKAVGKHPLTDTAGHAFIDADFASLQEWTPTLEARWHFHTTHTGHMEITFGGLCPSTGTFLITFQGETHKLNSTSGPAVCTITDGGLCLLTVHSDGESKDTCLGDLIARGPAMHDAALVRARWRPFAAHSTFSSSQCETTPMWVMTTRVEPGCESYSPITTPFGYYGSSFTAEGTSTGQCNFSLWSYGKGNPTPQESWSHLLAAGSPQADFGSFGHEGSGVKLRGDWHPFLGVRELTLALRQQSDPPFATYFSYYLDNKEHWKLYGVGRTYVGPNAKSHKDLFPGNFIEVPGPPQTQRSGDHVRRVYRRGWCFSADKWYPLDRLRREKFSEPANKLFSSGDGWFVMGMGGLAHEAASESTAITLIGSSSPPSFLDPEHTRELYNLPARWGNLHASGITADAAIIEAEILQPGSQPKVTLFYGPSDCLTFTRDLGYHEVTTRYWPHAVECSNISNGICRFELANLPSSTRLYYRLLIENSEGKLWTFSTEHLETTAKNLP